MMRIKDLQKRYVTNDAEILALSDINLDIRDGEFVTLLGPSGCGKSTLLRIIAGLLPASQGEVAINGARVTGPGPERAMVFQDYALFPWMTVEANVEFGLEARDVPPAERHKISRDLLRVVGLGDFAKKFPHHLSGGMKQRVSIARALAVDPQILLMDEPFGALDAQTRSVLQEELLRIWRLYSKTVVFVTHSIEEAIYLSDRIVVMTARPGRIKTIISVEDERPRDMTAPAMAEMQRRVRTVLSEEINRAAELEQADLVSAG
ncbi:MAG TPA: ABC transporter ATP-binding protein [Xanthobacteraceae bacterium]|nr:ABC transporter ATP-binding protein [Xanthobacteraceae bacterium]